MNDNNCSAFVIETGKRLSIFVIWLLPLVMSCANSTDIPKPPIALPFEVHRGGERIESELRIIERRTYTFELQYFYKEHDQDDRARVWRLAGGAVKDQSNKWIEPGAPLRVILKIIQKPDEDGQFKFEKTISYPRLSSWGGDNLNARLADVDLDPGVYRVSVENLDEAPEFKGIKVGLRIARAYLGK